MKRTMILMLAALGLSACTTGESLNTFAVGMCEKSSSCTVSDTTPRYGPQQQRAVEDGLRGPN
ncbi:MAG: hypothetical protein ACK4GG_09310 [Sphingomonas sp.]